ncbi:MAG: hypothetical protein II736_06760, partial [Clostridia bacterium]|nr:hypothetical protein [Clostridia bacterium]
MRDDRFLRALGDIDDSYVDGALEDIRPAPARPVKRIVVTIALAAAVAITALFFGLNIGRARAPEADPAVTSQNAPTGPGHSVKPRPPVIKPGAPLKTGETGTEQTDTETPPETDPPVTEPPATEPPRDPATEPYYTEPVTEPATEPATEPPDPPVEIDGITGDDLYVMLYTETGHTFNEPATEQEKKDRARSWYFTALGLNSGMNAGMRYAGPQSGEYDPRIRKASVASLIYTTARELEVSLPSVREWKWFDDFSEG